jgi:hypothetical protein
MDDFSKETVNGAQHSTHEETGATVGGNDCVKGPNEGRVALLEQRTKLRIGGRERLRLDDIVESPDFDDNGFEILLAR